MKPPMIPDSGREVDAVNFRSVKESESVDIGASRVPQVGVMKTDPDTPGEKEVDPFEEFNSGMFCLIPDVVSVRRLTKIIVTLHHDGEHDNGVHHHEPPPPIQDEAQRKRGSGSSLSMSLGKKR